MILEKRKWHDRGKDKSFGQFKKQNNGPTSRQFDNNFPPYPKCKKFQRSVYLFGKNVYYKCGQSGHYASECHATPVNDTKQTKK